MDLGHEHSRSNGKFLLSLFFASITYFAAGRLGLSTPFTNGNVSPVWPASGIALALTLIGGNRLWPGILLGAFFTNFLSPIPPVAALGLAIGNTCAAVTGASLLRRFRFQRSLGRLRDVLHLIFLAAIVSTMVSATCGVSILFATHVQAWSAVLPAWLMYWLGDAMGVLLVAPLALNLGAYRILGQRKVEFIALMAMVILSSLAVFGNLLFQSSDMNVLAFAVFPFVIWGALRLGIFGAASSTLCIAIVATCQTAFGHGPFAGNVPIVNAVLLQVFFAVLAVSGLTLAAVVAERETLESERLQALLSSAAREARLRLAAIVESSDDAIYAKDMNEIITDWNRSAERLYGFSADEMIGQPIKQIIPLERIEEMQYLMKRIAAGEKVEHVETIRQKKDGTRVFVSVTISPMFGEAGQVTGASVIARDISQQKVAEEALRRAEKLAATGRLAASIAHEINNPLASLTNLLYLIQSQPSLDEQTRSYVTSAEAELRRTAHITHQMLAFHRESLQPAKINIADLLDMVIEAYSVGLRKARLKLQRDYEAEPEIEGYPGELRQVFSNFLTNAIEACSPGGAIQIRLHASRDWKDSNRRGIRIVFADNGAGIPPHSRARLFEPFFTTKGERGTGLGLWVSSGIVQKYGGSVQYFTSTRPGRTGTVFSIFLATAPAEQPKGIAQGNTA